jgi:hypothetical protein
MKVLFLLARYLPFIDIGVFMYCADNLTFVYDTLIVDMTIRRSFWNTPC